ncbi:hypothetical protein [Salinimicrobium sp. GXAS 041]|uniref:hypothetical protein n=1 Tax=Salinimicrobium sp. GXAS 041 TaxID=3400806 RepID=UPI003C7368E9
MRRKMHLLLLLLGSSIFGQELLDIHHTSLAEYIQAEEEMESVRIPEPFKFVSITGHAPPIQFLREDKSGLEILSTYSYRASDSTLTDVIYEWDEMRHSKKATFNERKRKSFQKVIIEKFKDLEKSMTALYGEPDVEEKLSRHIQSGAKAAYKKKIEWHPNDSTKIILSTELLKRTGLLKIEPSQKMRLHMWNPSKKQEENRFDILYNLSYEFLQVLKEGNMEDAKFFFSDSVRRMLTDKQVKTLMNNLDSTHETGIMSINNYPGPDGSGWATFTLGYKTDSSEFEKEYLKIIFDSENKIVGVKQMNSR